MRAPMLVRWPGHIQPGTVKTEIFASLDWVPTFVDIAGGPKGDGLKKQIEAGKYPGIVKTTLDGVDQRDYLEGKTETSARDYFFYYTGPTPSAVRYKNWKFYYTMEGSTGLSALAGAQTFGWTQLTNLKRDPFEQAVGDVVTRKAVLAIGGALASPSTAYLYDWNVLPVGQQLWLKELESYGPFPPLQDPASYNLSSILAQVKKAGNKTRASDRRPMSESMIRTRRSIASLASHRMSIMLATVLLTWLAARRAGVRAGRSTAFVERRRGEEGDRRVRAGDDDARPARSSSRPENASRRSTRTARSGSNIRCTRR